MIKDVIANSARYRIRKPFSVHHSGALAATNNVGDPRQIILKITRSSCNIDSQNGTISVLEVET